MDKIVIFPIKWNLVMWFSNLNQSYSSWVSIFSLFLGLNNFLFKSGFVLCLQPLIETVFHKYILFDRVDIITFQSFGSELIEGSLVNNTRPFVFTSLDFLVLDRVIFCLPCPSILNGIVKVTSGDSQEKGGCAPAIGWWRSGMGKQGR